MFRMCMVPVLAAVILFSGTLVVMAEPAEESLLSVPVGEIELAPPASIEAKRSAVAFPHSLHFTNNCMTCHHIWQGEPELSTCTASSCHDFTTAAETAEAGKLKIMYYKKAYHAMCINCHRDIKIQNKALAESKTVSDAKMAKAGPTGCVQCHPKD